MIDIKASVHNQFGRVAKNYRTSQVHASGQDLQQIVELARQPEVARQPYVLDAGCGAGHTSLTVAPYSSRVVAFDLTPPMLEQVEQLAAERGLSNVETRLGDVEHMPFDDATFDLIVSRLSAHHWPNPLLALQEGFRVLKPGGRFILSDIVAPAEPAHDTFLQAFELLRDPSHVRDHSISQWLALFEQVGFKPRVVSTWRLSLDFAELDPAHGHAGLNVSMLKALFETASDEIRRSFEIQANYHFALYGALLEGEHEI